ncbi:MAG: C25 family cysteine peptidase, partial [Rudanella sp.]|nr:C25 family cysteine peptidase [Rudanella sp.]
MRCLLLWLLLLCLVNPALAQAVGDEWIVAGQPYYKIPIAKAGVYQITPDHFKRAGLNPETLDPQTLRLFHRGSEQAISISGEADGRFDTGDMLTFAGQGNDGIPDSALYRPASAQPHPFYSLFSDTTYYFLTWRSGVRGLRQPLKGIPSTEGISAETRVVLIRDYPAGIIYPLGASANTGTILSHYDAGEGWTGPVIAQGQSYSVVLPLTEVIWVDSIPLRMQAWVAGRNAGGARFPDGTIRPHRVAWWVNGKRVGESVFENYQTGRFEVLLPVAELGKPDALTLIMEPLTEGERVSLSAVRVQHTQRAGHLPPAVLAPELIPVRFRTFDPKRANYLIVSHPMLRKAVGGVADPVRAYATYRASLAGGSYDTLTVNVGELFDQFTHGERSPLAIRRFAQFMHRNGRQPILFLIGQSRDPQGVRKNPNAALLDLIPNGGWPGSDALLVEGLNGETRDVPTLSIGRLNANNPQIVFDYLAKVIDYEAVRQPQLWRKQVLHLSGGRSADELSRFRGFVDDFSGVAKRAPLGTLVQTRSKQTDEPVETIPIADLVNRGLGLITVFGHSGLDVTDVDIGFATDDRRDYHNRGRYPFLLVNGCAAGNVFFGRPTFGTDWVTASDRGAIGFLAHTHNGFSREMKTFSDAFYATLTDLRWQTEAVGRVHQETIRRYLQHNQTPTDIANAQQFLLQGDPAIRLFPFDKPDYAFGEENQVAAAPKQRPTQPDSLLARVVLTNAGRAEPGPLPVRVRHYSTDGQLVGEQVISLPAPLFSDTLNLCFPNLNKAANGPILELRLNPDNRLQECDFNNNTHVIGGKSSSELPFPPDNMPPHLEVVFDGQLIENDEFVSPRPVITLRIRDENPRLFRRDTTGLLLYLQRPDQSKTGAFERLSWKQGITFSEEGGRAFQANFRPAEPWPDGRYQLEVYASDLSGNRAAPYQIRFQIAHEPGILTAGVGPNPFGGTNSNAPTRFQCTLSGTTPPDAI